MSSSSDKNIAASKELSAKKRPALADVTNLKNSSRSGVRTSVGSSKPMVPCVAKIAKTKNEPTELSRHIFPASLTSSSTSYVPPSNTRFPGAPEHYPNSTVLPSLIIDDVVSITTNSLLDPPKCIDVSPTKQICVSVPLGESMSTCDLRNGEFGYIDDLEVVAVSSAEGKRSNVFSALDDVERAGSTSERGALIDGEKTDQAIKMEKLIGPQFRATITSDIYRHLRASEVNNRPSIDLMQRIQIDISASMRATLIDWLVEDLGYSSRQPLRLYCDNKAACDIAHNPVQHDRTKKRRGSTSERGALIDGEKTDQVIKMEKLIGPQFRATITSDIYRHLRASEVNNRPSIALMQRIQIDISASMRATLIDWLVEVAEEYRLVRVTLFLTVNYIDRYLSGKEISPPHVKEFCYITDNTYLKEEILQMESAVLNNLRFEMASPTTICFLRRFICAAQPTSEVLSIQLECMANYIAELSLLEFSLLHYPPSLIAASATFLASYLLSPYNRSWCSKLVFCTHYQPSDLCECVKVLLQVCRSGGGRNLPAIRNKYSHHKYKFVAKKYCPLSIPPEFFEDVCN